VSDYFVKNDYGTYYRIPVNIFSDKDIILKCYMLYMYIPTETSENSL
jgi:hypothetical protein